MTEFKAWAEVSSLALVGGKWRWLAVNGVGRIGELEHVAVAEYALALRFEQDGQADHPRRSHRGCGGMGSALKLAHAV